MNAEQKGNTQDSEAVISNLLPSTGKEELSLEQ